MLLIAGQTAGPIGLKFFCGHSWVARGCYRLLKNSKFFFKFLFFFSRATPGPSAIFIFKWINLENGTRKEIGKSDWEKE